ncbi:YqjF family protein [Peribacillus kribbensis]|uniref:YqjF family protein n=1 Tax=Peribacillus kribbensis TaxID=356658 RepID=UPI00042671EC|nr:DUF2071 domain-containing protein [Peribacillus kribbensis]
MHKEFSQTSHRPYSLPEEPWLLKQEWNDLLFLHWPVSSESLRSLIPEEFQLDVFKGDAWLTLTPFKVTGMRFHGLPPIPGMTSYLELNVRTYVRFNGIPGIFFFSLDADLFPSVFGAKTFFSLPYKLSKMSFKSGEDFFFRSSRRFTGRNLQNFAAFYHPDHEVFRPDEGTLDQWLLERYALFTKRGEKLCRGDIHHVPWSVSRTAVRLEENTLFPCYTDIFLQKKPICHYSRFQKVFFFPLKEVY